MAPNGTSRKTPSAPSKASANFIPRSLIDSTLSSGSTSRLKLRPDHSAPPKPTKPGSWDSGHADGQPASPPLAPTLAPSPTIALSFSTGRPLHDAPDITKCVHCRRAISRHVARAHVETCLAKKQEKQRRKKEAKDARDAAARKAEKGAGGGGGGGGGGAGGGSDDEGAAGGDSDSDGGGGEEGGTAKKATKAAGGAGLAGQAGKKRKATEGTAEEGREKKKKKKEDEKKVKVKVKAPVDVERQCGVELPQGGQCARSLTCKSHSMGAKRAVPGRSAPYDKLLAEYQRKNQAKLQKAALDAQALPEDSQPEGPVDSDEEKDQVLAAIARSRPRPLFQPQLVPLRRKYTYVRLKEMLGNALGGRSGGLFGTDVAATTTTTAAAAAAAAAGGGGGNAPTPMSASFGAGRERASVDLGMGRRSSSIAEGRDGSVDLMSRETLVEG